LIERTYTPPDSEEIGDNSESAASARESYVESETFCKTSLIINVAGSRRLRSCVEIEANIDAVVFRDDDMDIDDEEDFRRSVHRARSALFIAPSQNCAAFRPNAAIATNACRGIATSPNSVSPVSQGHHAAHSARSARP
jgi:hypothetical protein